ncbi:MAG: hypothetical protein RIB80_04690 [Rhodospirillales bacterium]
MNEDAAGRVIHSAHMIKETQMRRAEERAQKMPLILPLRHPFVVEEAWQRRGRPIAELLEGFRSYQDRFWPIAAHVMPVDSDRREACLAEMADGLGLPLKTDWTVINGREKTHDLRWTDCTPSDAVKRLADEMTPILERYY